MKNIYPTDLKSALSDLKLTLDELELILSEMARNIESGFEEDIITSNFHDSIHTSYHCTRIVSC